MTIGEVIDTLERAKPEAQVAFSFCRLSPSSVDSWRGIYAEAALGFECEKPLPTVAELLKELRAAINGKVFCGWKGGDYIYTRDTPLHIDNSGEWTSTELIRVQVTDWRITLHTAREEY